MQSIFFSPAALTESILEMDLQAIQEKKQKKTKNISLAYYHTSLLTKNIFNMLINLSHQTGCWITQNETTSRNESAPQDKTFEAPEISITWTLKAISRVS